LQATALVNEAYLKLAGSANVNWENRTHFFGVCAQVMRRILVDWARSRQTGKRGGIVAPLELDDALAAAAQPGSDLVASTMRSKRWQKSILARPGLWSYGSSED
jgi:hypothetical protein